MAVAKRKIAVLTGKRGGFGAMLTLMQELERDPSMELQLIVTDMHLSPLFGRTVKEVEKWFTAIHKADLKQMGDSGEDRGLALGRAVGEMVKLLSKINPDILVLLGDRGEVLAAATAALELNIPVAHILGGDVAGNRDGIRIHAITKLAHLHFPANTDAYKRILKLGEEKWRVFNFGSTYIDRALEKEYTPEDAVRTKFGLGKEPYLLCIQHPTTMREGRSFEEATAVYEALSRFGMRSIIIWPCSDQGYKGVLRALDAYTDCPYFSVHKNIEAVDFWGLMAGASLMVGNSSSGLMETPYFTLPAVNIGHRQDGRARDTNVLSVLEPTPEKILAAMRKALSPAFKKNMKNHFVFGRGGAGKKIARVLKEIPLGASLLEKKITF